MVPVIGDAFFLQTQPAADEAANGDVLEDGGAGAGGRGVVLVGSSGAGRAAGQACVMLVLASVLQHEKNVLQNDEVPVEVPLLWVEVPTPPAPVR